MDLVLVCCAARGETCALTILNRVADPNHDFDCELSQILRVLESIVEIAGADVQIVSPGNKTSINAIQKPVERHAHGLHPTGFLRLLQTDQDILAKQQDARVHLADNAVWLLVMVARCLHAVDITLRPPPAVSRVAFFFVPIAVSSP